MNRLRKYLIIPALFLVAVVIGSCSSVCSTKDGADKKITKDNLPPPLPPGQAEVGAVINNYSEDENNFIAEIKIEEVTAYGPSTPPLPVGSEMKIIIPKRKVDNQTEQLKRGEKKLMRISFTQGMGDSKQWTLVNFSK